MTSRAYANSNFHLVEGSPLPKGPLRFAISPEGVVRPVLLQRIYSRIRFNPRSSTGYTVIAPATLR